MSNGFLSKRVKRKDQSGITSDRYEFLALNQAEPDLGDPKVGVSSIGVNPYSSSLDDIHFLISDASETGKRYWVPKTTVLTGNVTQPGSVTVRKDNAIIGIANSITELNFIGSGVTITTPASFPGATTGESVDIAISLYYTPVSGFSTISENVIGGIASVTSLSVSGISTLGTLQVSSGIATASSGIITYYGDGQYLSGISKSLDYADNAGISTYADTAGIATYADTAGIATYANNAGIATYADNAGISTYANSAGIATYTPNAGIATYAPNAGIATYSDTAGIATYANNAGIATYADNAGISTYADNAGIATYSNNAGIATYADVAGISTYADTAGIATYTPNAGIATYANSAGIATYTPNAGIATYAGNAGISTFAEVSGISTYTSEWIITPEGTTNYVFNGPGFASSTSDPILYLVRGQKYKFTNNDGGLHPFRIQSSPNGSAGTQYNDGVTNNDASEGTLIWDVQFDSPSTLYYQCTSHNNMGGKIYILDEAISSDANLYTTGIITASSFYGDGSNLTGVISNQYYADTAGIATYANSAGIATYANSAGIATYSDNAGISTYSDNAGISTYADTAGIATYANSAGIATYANSAGVTTALETSRTFEITGDIVGSPISFDGTGNVSIAATIQPNSVSLGDDTTGNYVATISGTSGEIEVSGSGSESAAVTIGLPTIINVDGVNSSGVVTATTIVATTGTFSGNVSIAGTLTYEDVTNIDSVGIITARSGINVDSGGINASGVVTATTFSGSGASLTNIPNSALDNSSVSFGGVEISLGNSDSTPAFDLTDATNYPISSLTGAGTNVLTFLATPSSSNLASAITDETGTGSLVFATSPTLITPSLGQASATSINASGIVTASGGFNIGIQSRGTDIATGVITAFNFVGTGNTFAYDEVTKTINISIDSGGDAGGSGTFDVGITSSVFVSVTSGVGVNTEQTNNIFVGPGIAYSFPATSGRKYVIESIHVTNTYSNELYLVGRHDYNSGSEVPIAQRVIVPYQGSAELLDQPVVANPLDILRFQALSGVGTTAAGVDGGLDAFITYSMKIDDNYIGVGTTSPNFSDTEVFAASGNPAVIQSIKLCNYSMINDIDASVSIYSGGLTSGIRLGYLVYNLTIPKNSVIEILEKPKHLVDGNSIVARGDSDGLSVTVSGKYIVPL